MSSNIRLSPKHGLNPSLGVCFYCQQDNGEIILPGLMRGDREAPHRGVWNYNPCHTCEGYMKQGIICISVDESLSSDKKNPYRTGGWAVVKEEAIARLIQSNQKLIDDMLKQRVCFIPDDAWDTMGLPR